jgi:hypothetical protein
MANGFIGQDNIRLDPRQTKALKVIEKAVLPDHISIL